MTSTKIRIKSMPKSKINGHCRVQNESTSASKNPMANKVRVLKIKKLAISQKQSDRSRMEIKPRKTQNIKFKIAEIRTRYE